jgi:hypothetical protein
MLIRGAVEPQDSVKHQIKEKAEGGPRHQGAGGGVFEAVIERFGQQIEERHADDGAGTEAENQMQLVMQPQRQQSARIRAEKCRGGDHSE